MELHILGIGPGWVKFHFPVEEADHGLLRRIFDIPGVTKQVFNKKTRNLLVAYSPEALSLQQLLDAIRRDLPGVTLRAGHPDGLHDPTLEHFDFSPYGRITYRTLVSVNRSAERATGGFGDVGSLAPSILMVLTAFEFLRRPLAPRWFDYAWYAANFQYWYIREARERKKLAAGSGRRALPAAAGHG